MIDILNKSGIDEVFRFLSYVYRKKYQIYFLNETIRCLKKEGGDGIPVLCHLSEINTYIHKFSFV